MIEYLFQNSETFGKTVLAGLIILFGLLALSIIWKNDESTKPKP